jgi:glycine betaine/proline transport system permease protein
MTDIPKLPLDEIIDAALAFITSHLSFVTKAISHVTEDGIDGIVGVLLFLPPWLLILVISGAAWRIAGTRVAIWSASGLVLLWNLRLWEPTMQTLTLVTVATLIAILIGIPLGIWASLSERVYRLIMPILDFMQTMPAFVYLIPAIPFFGLGPVSGIFATVIFSMPPAIRLTTLGIRQVPVELIEAADAFGSTPKQKLLKVQLPLATPTIMAGINQTIMLALSMVVIAAMIGAGGLGGEVWKAIQRLEPGAGFEAGIAVVIVAMILDRITQNIGKRHQAETNNEE